MHSHELDSGNSGQQDSGFNHRVTLGIIHMLTLQLGSTIKILHLASSLKSSVIGIKRTTLRTVFGSNCHTLLKCCSVACADHKSVCGCS